MVPQVELFSFAFWKNLKTPKRHFEMNWPLRNKKIKISKLTGSILIFDLNESTVIILIRIDRPQRSDHFSMQNFLFPGNWGNSSLKIKNKHFYFGQKIFQFPKNSWKKPKLTLRKSLTFSAETLPPLSRLKTVYSTSRPTSNLSGLLSTLLKWEKIVWYCMYLSYQKYRGS